MTQNDLEGNRDEYMHPLVPGPSSVRLSMQVTRKKSLEKNQISKTIKLGDKKIGDVRGQGSRVRGQGQRSFGSRSKVTCVKPSLRVMVLAGGLTSTSSYFIKVFFL